VLSDIGGSVPNYFYYDGDQRRIITEDSQGRIYFLYDGEKVGVENNASGTTQAAYVNQGPSIYDPLIYMDRAGTKSYHLFNHIGTTQALASSAEALTDTYRWNAWGVQLASTGSATNPFGYVGAFGYRRGTDQTDCSIGARVLSPAAARWLTRDPVAALVLVGPAQLIQRAHTTYAYVLNRPTVLADPWGLRACECEDDNAKKNRECKEECEQVYRDKMTVTKVIAGGGLVGAAYTACVSFGLSVPGIGLLDLGYYTYSVTKLKKQRADCLKRCDEDYPVSGGGGGGGAR